jgi:hypothetical protein
MIMYVILYKHLNPLTSQPTHFDSMPYTVPFHVDQSLYTVRLCANIQTSEDPQVRSFQVWFMSIVLFSMEIKRFAAVRSCGV